ncbi:unnamed protein product [Nippostrongylus brasiliensis]|uniref:Pept_C1 domain-containing protein n=1 Tax=Nippostrongylus brasiliensis TaxID=27835 RepID=A0A0N4YFX0_NIPBR|nr:unnamed protein product [Nippostrongylus brasiliensis]
MCAVSLIYTLARNLYFQSFPGYDVVSSDSVCADDRLGLCGMQGLSAMVEMCLWTSGFPSGHVPAGYRIFQPNYAEGGVMGGMVTKISASQLLQMLALKDKMDKCLKSAGQKGEMADQSYKFAPGIRIPPKMIRMKAYGAQQAKGSNCKSAAVLNAMYTKACPMQTSSLVQSVASRALVVHLSE